jgi:hypothetical protein
VEQSGDADPRAPSGLTREEAIDLIQEVQAAELRRLAEE